jgi:outer membrane protein insertion porin family
MPATTTYDEDRLQYDKELLRRYYLKNGFADVHDCLDADAPSIPAVKKAISSSTITVEEGPRYTVADVAVNIGDAQS